MNQQHFNAVFNRLTERRREVLLKLLANEKDEAIANSLHIQKPTVRKHREEICKLFGLNNEFSDERRSKLPQLIALFAKYKPELLNQNTSELPQTENFSEDKTISENPDFVGREDAIAGVKLQDEVFAILQQATFLQIAPFPESIKQLEDALEKIPSCARAIFFLSFNISRVFYSNKAQKFH
ncbi:LuxR C-terminal-related transcriptional regulator [Nostoc sp.]|uniref:LuxR C-terminal-related transcriptional regulator n=1 Tax=Nostoc sp. TaxID=1180 RepID=UPI002FF501EB